MVRGGFLLVCALVYEGMLVSFSLVSAMVRDGVIFLAIIVDLSRRNL